MHDSEYIDKNYRESIRRNRQERWAEFKRNYGASGGSMSGKEALFAVAFVLVAFVAAPVAVLYFHNRDGQKGNAEKGRAAETRLSVPVAYPPRPPRQIMDSVPKKTPSVDFGKKKDKEMSRKYAEIVKKKQRLSKEMDGLLRQYTKHCSREPMGRGRQRMCDRIDRKNQECYRKLRRLGG